MPAADYERVFLGSTDFLPAIERHVPDLLEELRGIAEGAAQPFETVLVRNLMDEEWWFGGAAERDACTVVGRAANGYGATLLAQNMDLPALMDGDQAVLRIRPREGAEQVVLTAAGMLGLNGANAAGVGLCANSLDTLRHSDQGLPVAFVIRGALAARDADAAVGFVRGVPHASGQHYAIAERRSITSLECSGEGVTTVAHDGLVAHANHPLTSTDVDDAIRAPAAERENSEARQRFAEEMVGAIEDVERCKSVLADRTVPLCVVRAEWMTFGAIVMEVGERTQVSIAPGPPDRTAWHEFSLPGDGAEPAQQATSRTDTQTA